MPYLRISLLPRAPLDLEVSNSLSLLETCKIRLFHVAGAMLWNSSKPLFGLKSVIFALLLWSPTSYSMRLWPSFCRSQLIKIPRSFGAEWEPASALDDSLDLATLLEHSHLHHYYQVIDLRTGKVLPEFARPPSHTKQFLFLLAQVMSQPDHYAYQIQLRQPHPHLPPALPKNYLTVPDRDLADFVGFEFAPAQGFTTRSRLRDYFSSVFDTLNIYDREKDFLKLSGHVHFLTDIQSLAPKLRAPAYQALLGWWGFMNDFTFVSTLHDVYRHKHREWLVKHLRFQPYTRFLKREDFIALEPTAKGVLYRGNSPLPDSDKGRRLPWTYHHLRVGLNTVYHQQVVQEGTPIIWLGLEARAVGDESFEAHFQIFPGDPESEYIPLQALMRFGSATGSLSPRNFGVISNPEILRERLKNSQFPIFEFSALEQFYEQVRKSALSDFERAELYGLLFFPLTEWESHPIFESFTSAERNHIFGSIQRARGPWKKKIREAFERRTKIEDVFWISLQFMEDAQLMAFFTEAYRRAHEPTAPPPR